MVTLEVALCPFVAAYNYRLAVNGNVREEESRDSLFKHFKEDNVSNERKG